MSLFSRHLIVSFGVVFAFVVTMDWRIMAEDFDAGLSPTSRWLVGFDAVFAAPRLTDNVGLIEEVEDASANVVIQETTFRHDLEFSPRAWLEYRCDDEFSLRTSWWQLDSDAASIGLGPDASGFGEIRHPELYIVDLSITQPAERLAAASSVDLRVLDLEIAKRTLLGGWDLSYAAGIRHVSVDTTYQLTALNTVGALSGQATRRREVDGVGPLVRIRSGRMWGDRVLITAGLTGAVLLSESETRLSAIEDVDLPTAVTTDAFADGQQVLPMIEARFTVERAIERSGRGHWLVRGGLESQWYGGLQTPAGEDTDLGVLGLFIGIGSVR